MIHQEDINAPAGGQKKIRWLWFAYLFFLLPIFWFTSPVILDQPLQQKGLGLKEGGGVSIVTGIATAEKGSPLRRMVYFVFLGIGLTLLTRTTNRFQVNGVLGWTLIFYLGWMLFSLTWSINTLYTLRRIVVVDILWFSALIIASKLSLRELATLAALVTGLTLFVGIGNELRLGALTPHLQEWRFSGLIHSIPMGWNCGLLALSSMFLGAGEKRRGYRIFFMSITITAIVFMLLTKSRTPVAAAIVGIGYYWFIVATARRKIFVILGVVISLSACYIAIGDRLIVYGEAATTLGRGETATASVSDLTGRIPLWKYCFTYAAERPFQGYGFTSFLNPKSIIEIHREVGWIPNSLHSGYINELMGTGFIGMSALIFMLILALTRAFRLSKQLPAYHYVVAVILWLSINLALEAGLIIGGTFMTFFSMAVLTRLAFLPAEEWR